MKKTWLEFEADVNILIIRIADYRPNTIVPVMTGGLIPAAIIAEKMGIWDVRPIIIERKGKSREIVYDVQGSIVGLEVLLVEDALQTGLGPFEAKKEFTRRGAHVRIASVYVVPESLKRVDYFGELCESLPDLPWKPSRTGDKIVKPDRTHG